MDIYKSLGIFSIIQLWACLLFMIRKWPGNKSMSYSAHAALTKHGQIFYFVIFCIHLIAFYIFSVKWFAPVFHLPKIYTIILLLATVGQLGAVLIPTTGGIKTTVHDITAYFMHMLLMPLCLIVSFSSYVSNVARTIALFTAVYMVTAWILFGFVKKSKDYHLVIQTIYGLSFHFAILAAVYIR